MAVTQKQQFRTKHTKKRRKKEKSVNYMYISIITLSKLKLFYFGYCSFNTECSCQKLYFEINNNKLKKYKSFVKKVTLYF